MGLDVNKWPVGGSRLETIGNIIYGKALAYILGSDFDKLSCRIPVGRLSGTLPTLTYVWQRLV